MITIKGKYLGSVPKINQTDKSAYRVLDILEMNKVEGWVVKKVKCLDNALEFKANSDIECEIIPIVYKTDRGEAKLSYRMA